MGEKKSSGEEEKLVRYRPKGSTQKTEREGSFSVSSKAKNNQGLKQKGGVRVNYIKWGGKNRKGGLRRGKKEKFS